MTGRRGRWDADRGSTIPLILGFFLVAAVMVAGSIALGQAFVQQRELQDVCDGAAAAAASGADLDRDGAASAGDALQFDAVDAQVQAYLARDPGRAGVRVRSTLSADRTRITLRCEQQRDLALGGFFGRSRISHTAVSSARAPVLG